MGIVREVLGMADSQVSGEGTRSKDMPFRVLCGFSVHECSTFLGGSTFSLVIDKFNNIICQSFSACV
ncbi:hypothetical protein ACF0H5_011596 [Mactra antiquata]